MGLLKLGCRQLTWLRFDETKGWVVPLSTEKDWMLCYAPLVVAFVRIITSWSLASTKVMIVEALALGVPETRF